MARVMISLEWAHQQPRAGHDAQFPDTPTIVWGDPDSVTQVCYNLLTTPLNFYWGLG